MKYKISLAIIFCLSLKLLSHAQQLGFYLPAGKKKVQIPIEIYNNLVVVPVLLNKVLPLKFIVDTGVRTAILTQKSYSDILNLAYARKYVISGPGGEKLINAYITNNVSLDLPGVHGKGHAMLVLEDDYLELPHYLGTDVHGILGYELFSRFIISIDYERKLLTIMIPEGFRKPKKYETLSITIEDTKPFIKTPVVLHNGVVLNAKLLMDSGASHGLMLDPHSDSNIKLPKEVISSVIGRGLGGEITGKYGRIKSLELGRYTLNDVIANFPDPNSYLDTLTGASTFRHGAIGGEVMSRFTIIFNFSKEEIYIRKNAAFKKAFHFNLSGLTIRAKGEQLEIFEVTDVRKNSCSNKAGIQKGDLINKINGIDTKNLNLNSINHFFNSRPGKKLKIEINRQGNRMQKRFSLEDQI